jgi:cytochrome c-type biogenesis protein
MFTETVSYPAAILAGLLSFFSPCILPLIPAYFTFISGFSLEELTDNPSALIRRKVIFSTVAYVSGFAFVFILMGASASFLGSTIATHRSTIRIFGGLLIIGLGVHLTGLVRLRGLDFEKRIHPKKRPLHLLGTFAVGMAFAAGWSPCIGPLLGSILIIAGGQETVRQGVLLLAAYSVGLATPFIGIAISINFILKILTRATRTLKLLNTMAGLLLIGMGLLLVTDRLHWLIPA